MDRPARGQGGVRPPRRSVQRTESPPVRVRLIVLGSVDQGDDALGPMAVARLSPEVWPFVDVQLRPGLDVADLVGVPPGGACLVVDAAEGITAGVVTFISFERYLRRGAAALPVPRAAHELPLPELIRRVETVRGSLPVGGFLVAGGTAFGHGELPSRAVALAIPGLAAAIEVAVTDCTARRRRSPRRLAPLASAAAAD